MSNFIGKLVADWEMDQPERRISLTSVSVLSVVALLLVMVPVFLMHYPTPDVALRYAPMAEAFGEGNFSYAFHPRIPMLHTVLAGCVVFLTGCGGFTACKIISALFYAAGIFPLTALAGRIFNRRVAMISGIIYCCASPLLPLGYSGLRDSLKSFLLLLLANALVRIYQERDHYCGYMYCGIACGLAVLVRVEMIIFSLFPLWMMFFLECRRSRAALRSYLGCLLAVICVSPAFIQNYLQVGAAIPDSQSAEQFFKLTGHHASLGEVLSGGIIMVAVIHISALLLSLVRRRYLWYVGGALGGAAAGGFCYWLCNNKFSWPDGVGRYWFMVLRGSLACYGFAVLPGITIRIWRREWRVEETLLILFYLLHLLTVLVQFILFQKNFYVSDRYLESALPLLFGWAAYFTVMIWLLLDFLQKKWQFPRYILRAAAAVLITVPIVIYVIFSYLPVLKLSLPGQTNRTFTALQKIASEIRAHGVDEEQSRAAKIKLELYEPPYKTGITYWEFCNGKWRLNRNSKVVVAYFAGVKRVDSGGDYSLYVWKKKDHPAGLPRRRGKLLFRTGDGKYEYQLWGNRK